MFRVGKGGTALAGEDIVVVVGDELRPLTGGGERPVLVGEAVRGGGGGLRGVTDTLGGGEGVARGGNVGRVLTDPGDLEGNAGDGLPGSAAGGAVGGLGGVGLDGRAVLAVTAGVPRLGTKGGFPNVGGLARLFCPAGFNLGKPPANRLPS